MAIYKSSRYEGVGFIAIREKKSSLQTIRFLDARVPKDNSALVGETIVYRVKPGDTLDLLAFQFYGNEIYWYLIADANDIFFAHDLVPGRDIIIPDRRNINNAPSVFDE